MLKGIEGAKISFLFKIVTLSSSFPAQFLWFCAPNYPVGSGCMLARPPVRAARGVTGRRRRRVRDAGHGHDGGRSTGVSSGDGRGELQSADTRGLCHQMLGWRAVLRLPRSSEEIDSTTAKKYSSLPITVAAVWTAAAAIHREKNTVEAAAAAGLQPQQAAANKPSSTILANKPPSLERAPVPSGRVPVPQQHCAFSPHEPRSASPHQSSDPADGRTNTRDKEAVAVQCDRLDWTGREGSGGSTRGAGEPPAVPSGSGFCPNPRVWTWAPANSAGGAGEVRCGRPVRLFLFPNPWRPTETVSTTFISE
jgi:hypothetical protein